MLASPVAESDRALPYHTFITLPGPSASAIPGRRTLPWASLQSSSRQHLNMANMRTAQTASVLALMWLAAGPPDVCATPPASDAAGNEVCAT